MATEVFVDEENIIVKLEVPGMNLDDFDIQVSSDVLIVRGEKKFQREQKKGQYYQSECAYGRFGRAITLPGEVDDAKAEASYRNGLLKIALPKAKKNRRRISIVRL